MKLSFVTTIFILVALAAARSEQVEGKVGMTPNPHNRLLTTKTNSCDDPNCIRCFKSNTGNCLECRTSYLRAEFFGGKVCLSCNGCDSSETCSTTQSSMKSCSRCKSGYTRVYYSNNLYFC